MSRFSKDYALVRTSTGQVMAESHSMERLEKLLSEYAADDIACEIVKSATKAMLSRYRAAVYYRGGLFLADVDALSEEEARRIGVHYFMLSEVAKRGIERIEAEAFGDREAAFWIACGERPGWRSNPSY